MYCVAQVHNTEDDPDNYTFLISTETHMKIQENGQVNTNTYWDFKRFKQLVKADIHREEPSYGFYLILE